MKKGKAGQGRAELPHGINREKLPEGPEFKETVQEQAPEPTSETKPSETKPFSQKLFQEEDFPRFHELTNNTRAIAVRDYGGWYSFRPVLDERSDLEHLPRPGAHAAEYYGKLWVVLLVGEPKVVGNQERHPVEIWNFATVSPETVQDPEMFPYLHELLYTRAMNRCMRTFLGNKMCSAEELPGIKASEFTGGVRPDASELKEHDSTPLDKLDAMLKKLKLTREFVTIGWRANLEKLDPAQYGSIMGTLNRMAANAALLEDELLRFREKFGEESYNKAVVNNGAKPAKKEQKKAPEPKPEPAKVEADTPKQGGFFGNMRL